MNLRKGLLWAWLDVVCQYRRSRIGPLWETINVVVMMLGLTLVSSAIFGGDIVGLIGYIGLGVITWSAINSLITEGSTAFVKNASLITSSNISVDLFVGRTIFKILITFGHHLILYFVGVALLILPLGWTSLLAIPGIILLFVNGFWIVTVLAFICARFRDVELIVRNLLQLAFSSRRYSGIISRLRATAGSSWITTLFSILSRSSARPCWGRFLHCTTISLSRA